MTTPTPTWFATLASGDDEAETGIHWLTAEEQAEAAEQHADLQVDLLGEYEDLLDEEELEAAETMLERALLVGRGVEGGRYSMKKRQFRTVFTYEPVFWIDPDVPDTLLCALNEDYPPQLWFPVGQTIESIQAALAVYFADVPLEPDELPLQSIVRVREGYTWPQWPESWRTVRMLVGVVENMAGLENGLVFRSSFCRDFQAQATAQTAVNDPVQITAFNTVNSYAEVILEHHQWAGYSVGDDEGEDEEGDVAHPVVAQITYPPAGQAAVIERVNAARDTDYPPDLPLDVVATLYPFPMKGLPRLREALAEETEPGDITYVMGLLVATDNQNSTLEPELRRFLAHPDPTVRARVAGYAHMRRMKHLVQEMHDREADDAVRAHLAEMLAYKPPPAEDAD